MRALVTGATGFLGRHVVARLRERAVVTAHGRRPSPFGELDYLQGDLADPASAQRLLAPWRWDAVVNLAGPVTAGGEDLRTGIGVVSAHVNIALHVRRFAATARIVHASSMTVYGPADALPVGEAHPRRPQHLYGLAKSLAEDVLAGPELDTWTLRLPGLFSEHRTSGALYQFCSAARRGEPVRITANPPTAWDVLHVVDAADALVRAVTATGPAAGAVNISHGEPVDVVSIAQRIASTTGVPVEVPEGIAVTPFQLDIAKARALLGWDPPPLSERLAKLYEAYGAA